MHQGAEGGQVTGGQAEPRPLRWEHLLVGAALLLALTVLATVVAAMGISKDPPRVPRPPRYPVVLCHGLLGFGEIRVEDLTTIRYFRGIKADLESVGCRVVVTEVAKSAEIAVRARQLRDQLASGETPVNIIAHSMGGLDARYLISRLEGARMVASLTTISTPHRGSAFADWGLKNLGERLQIEAGLKRIQFDTSAFHDLTTEFMEKEFNPATPDHPDVRYFSFGAAQNRTHIAPALLVPHAILLEREGPNDGLVSVRSATWGRYLGTLDADHLDQINWNPLHDARPIYRRVVNLLAAQGL